MACYGDSFTFYFTDNILQGYKWFSYFHRDNVAMVTRQTIITFWEIPHIRDYSVTVLSDAERSRYCHCRCIVYRSNKSMYGGAYEECRLLGHKTPVRTSQETHYVSATEPSQLMLCKI
jgi:hypothetical protein